MLATIMCLTLATSAAASVLPENQVEPIADASVSQATIEQIYANHATEQSASRKNTELTDISTDNIFEKLSVVYLKIEKARTNCESSPAEDNRSTLGALIEEQEYYENILTSRGFVFLTQEEVDTIFGITNISPMLDTPTKPSNTNNHRFALSTTYSSTHESYVIDIVKNDTVARYIGALAEVYASKISGTIIAAVSPVLSWLPYEMLSFDPNLHTKAESDYQIRASFTLTPRFVWAGYEDDFRYNLEGTLHSTSVSEAHSIVSVINGKTITDVGTKDYTETTEHYYTAEVSDFVVYQYEEGSTAIQEKNKFEYFFEDEDGNRSRCSSITAPWAGDYFSLN